MKCRTLQMHVRQMLGLQDLKREVTQDVMKGGFPSMINLSHVHLELNLERQMMSTIEWTGFFKCWKTCSDSIKIYFYLSKLQKSVTYPKYDSM